MSDKGKKIAVVTLWVARICCLLALIPALITVITWQPEKINPAIHLFCIAITTWIVWIMKIKE